MKWAGRIEVGNEFAPGFWESLVGVQQRELKVREVLVQTAPVPAARFVVVHVLRESRPRKLVVAALAKVGAVRVADELHAVWISATA